MKFHFKAVGQPDTSPQWMDWRWQLKNLSSLSSGPTTPHADAGITNFTGGGSNFLSGTTPYYLKLIQKNPHTNLKHIVQPQKQEWKKGLQNMKDPLGEKFHSPVPRIIHRYPDRALFLVTDSCGVYCRYCTRKHFTGKSQAFIKKKDYDQALDYIKNSLGIREVILSGGDPLTLSDNRLKALLSDLRKIPHIEILRIASRMPVVCPMRLTPSLIKILQKFNPVFLLTHFNHPAEISKEAAESLSKTADGGILIFNQTVLLNGINNHPALIQALARRLLYLRVKPYYMFQCDPSQGTDHLRTSVENSRWIQRELWGRLSGLALPNLSLDIPGGGGKVGIVPDFLQEKTDGKWTYQGWDGIRESYVNPLKELSPPGLEEYETEWLALKNQPYGGKPQEENPTET